MKDRIFISAAGMITAVGGNASMSAASVRAGVSQAAETAILNKQLQPVKLATVPDGALPQIDPNVDKHISTRQLRLLALASAALFDLQEQGCSLENIPVFLALPEALAEWRTPSIAGSFIKQLAAQTGIALDVASSRTNSLGRAGGLHLLELAHRYFEAADGKQVIVGGVDSFFDPNIIARLDAEDRLLVPGNMDGFVPGEAAAFLLISRERHVTGGNTAAVAVANPGFGSEPGHRYSEKPYLGNGLSEAVAHALANGFSGNVSQVWTTLNGESFGQKELAVAMARNTHTMGTGAKVSHPAEYLGDTGAASGPVMLGLIHSLYAAQGTPARALVCCSSEGDARAAVSVSINE